MDTPYRRYELLLPLRFNDGTAVPRRLETDLQQTLNQCAESGETIVVEMPDRRLLVIQSLEAGGDDSLVDELLASNPKFQALVAKSKTSPRKPFAAGDRG
jgi:hypothetical protein